MLPQPFNNKHDDVAAIELRAVSRTFGRAGIRALQSLSLTIAQGDFIAVIGTSGSGKSTLLNLMGGIDRPDTGQVAIFAEVIHNNRDWARLRSEKIGFIFQSFHLLPTLTARENVEIPLFGRLRGAAARRQRALQLLEQVNLQHRADHTPGELSGGERQRVAIARSLVNSPSILLADEPTGNLDSATAAEILTLFRDIHRQLRTTLVLVTHEAHIADQADRVIQLKDGRIMADEDRR